MGLINVKETAARWLISPSCRTRMAPLCHTRNPIPLSIALWSNEKQELLHQSYVMD